jgi:hypothetical protein
LISLRNRHHWSIFENVRIRIHLFKFKVCYFSLEGQRIPSRVSQEIPDVTTMDFWSTVIVLSIYSPCSITHRVSSRKSQIMDCLTQNGPRDCSFSSAFDVKFSRSFSRPVKLTPSEFWQNRTRIGFRRLQIVSPDPPISLMSVHWISAGLNFTKSGKICEKCEDPKMEKKTRTSHWHARKGLENAPSESSKDERMKCICIGNFAMLCSFSADIDEPFSESLSSHLLFFSNCDVENLLKSFPYINTFVQWRYDGFW